MFEILVYFKLWNGKLTFQEAQNQIELECDITISNFEQSTRPSIDKFQELVQRCNANMWPPQLTVNFIPQALLQRLKGLEPLEVINF